MVVLRRLLPLAVLAVLLGVSVPAAGQEDLRAAAQRLRAAVAAEEARIADTRDGLRAAEARLAFLDERARKRQQQLQDTQAELVRTRARLTRLERKQEHAEQLLAENLRASYKAGPTSLVSVVMNADGFEDLLETFEYQRRIARRNASVLGATRAARKKVTRMESNLKQLRSRYIALARDAIEDRDRADAIRAALLRREQEQLRRLNGTAAQLASVRRRIDAIERRAAEEARRARAARTATNQAPKPVPSAVGGDVVARVVAAANEIATTPYVYGGGHGGNSSGYDCSGSISYALAAAGLLAAPLDSTGFMSWGEPGPGKRITVYANAGHAFMVVDGRRYDTSALRGGGTRWSNTMRSTAGFVARHPPGL
jgi:peptidoglycan hydrolase CwlO-like protein